MDVTISSSILLECPIHNERQFNYNEFFDNKIQEKLDEKSYRKFRVLTRSSFPSAKHYEDSALPPDKGKNVVLWCSNDYMGMSKHPRVLEATM